MSSDKQILASGMIWTALGKYSSIILGLVVTMVLARIISPEEFGTVALANVFISFLTILSSMGIAPAIIQRKDLTNNDLDSIFTFTIITGVFLAAVLFFCSWLIAGFYSNSQLVVVCQLLSLSVFFNTINMVPNALMSKNLRFKENAKRTVLLHLITAPIAIIAALNGAGVYSLLVSPIFTSIGIFIYNHHFYPVRLLKRFQFNSVKKILSYSLYQFFFQLTNFFTSNIDKLILGKSLGSKDLGYYQMSYQLIQIPAGNITSVVYPVLHPIFSKYQNDKQVLISKYESMIKFIAICMFPLGITLMFSASEIIYLFYGSNWEPAIPAFRIMSLAIPALVILPVTGTFFQSSGEIRYLFQIGLINAIVAISSVSVACLFFRSLTAVAWAVVIYNYSSIIVTYFYMYKKVLKTSLYTAILIFLKPIVLSIFIGCLLYIEGRLGLNHHIISLIIKCLTAVVCVIVYLKITGQIEVLKNLGVFSKRKK